MNSTGSAFPIAEEVDYLAGSSQGQFSASRSGALAYTSGAAGEVDNLQLTWFDRSGKAVGTAGQTGVFDWVAISPDGNAVAFERIDTQGGTSAIWLRDLERGSESRFTFGARSRFPTWSPDGSHIAFSTDRQGGPILQRATNGVGQDEVLDETPQNKRPTDWSRDGRYLIEQVAGGKAGRSIWVLPLFGDKKPFPFLQSEFSAAEGRVSLNGQWLAYVSTETNRAEVYVPTFPTPGGKWQVSTSGAAHPVWSRDGKELFFLGLDGKIMAVEIRSGSQSGKATFAAGVPKALFDTRTTSVFGANFDVGKDGRFLIPVPLNTASANVPITVVINWQAG